MKVFHRALFSCLFLQTYLAAQTFPENFASQLIALDLQNPVSMAFAPDGRIFITEQGGAVRIVKDDVLLEADFFFTQVAFEYERGMLGIALDPDFVNNQYVYLYYTVRSHPVHNRVTRVKANGDVAEPDSETIILELENLNTAGIHNGGAMHFAPDGKLYIAVGDGGEPTSAQDLDSYNGKLLRINSDGSVPEDNPFTEGSEQKKRIWAYGLRNPFTISIQDGTGKIYVNDVGNYLWEEINDATAPGQNFGWPMAEGKSTYPTLKDPIFCYVHSPETAACAIVGGTFFNPESTNYPSHWYDQYFYMDHCSGRIASLDVSAEAVIDETFSTGLPFP